MVALRPHAAGKHTNCIDFYLYLFQNVGVLLFVSDSSTGLVNCVSGLGLVCLVVALVGIKLKWFKHRLTFNNSNGDPEIASPSRGFYSANGSDGEGGGGGVHRSSSVSSEPQIVRATFRNFDEGFDITPPAVLPRKSKETTRGWGS